MSQIEEDSLSDELAKVRISFGESAEAYRKSSLHGNAADLERMLGLVEPKEGDRALDIGSGGGHTSVCLAAKGCRVTALDVTPAMLRETRKLAAEKKITLEARTLADAQALPFAKRSFDILATRLACHHLRAAPAAIREFARVLKPGGRLYVFDLSAPDDAELAKFLDGIEVLRDPSHASSLPPSQWRRMIESVGLETKSFAWKQRSPYPMASWLDRTATPDGARREIARRLAEAPMAAKKTFAIDEGPEGWRFGSPVIELLALKH